jgi:MinD-like ATPase involved in chromosome partitioning or flagellar assembly
MEPEVALAFTPEAWVEELHRHLTDHGGARVRQFVVEPEVALEETYDVLVASHRWPALTRAFVNDVHERGRLVLGVFDREEPSGRTHLRAIGVDDVVESDRGPTAIGQALHALCARRGATVTPEIVGDVHARSGRVVTVGGPFGAGRTEIAAHLGAALGSPLIDADDVAPSVAARLALSIEPNLRSAIDAVEHGRGALGESMVVHAASGLRVLAGLPNAGVWSHVRPGEVVRIVEQLAATSPFVVVDTAGALDDLSTAPRGRNAVARALLVEADVLVGVCAASPVGVARFLSWAAEATSIAPAAPMVIAVNRAPRARFQRGELYEELTRSLPPVDVVFAPDDRRVTEAMWDGRLAAKGPFTRAVDRLGALVGAARPAERPGASDRRLEIAS